MGNYDEDEWDELRQTYAWMNVQPHKVLEDYRCPFCGDGFKSDEMVICGTFPDETADEHMFFAHNCCMPKRRKNTLEKIGYSLSIATGAEME